MNRREFISSGSLAALSVAMRGQETPQLVAAPLSPGTAGGQLTAVNVGFGDTGIFKLGDKTVMVDCYQEPKFGEEFTRYLPGRIIDLLILTHRHFDHYWGIELLLRDNMVVKEIWESPFIGDMDPGRFTRVMKWEQSNGVRARFLVGELQKRGALVREVDTTTAPVTIAGHRFEILHPGPEFVHDVQSTVHDACLVVKVSTPRRENAALLLGDTTIRGQDQVFRTKEIAGSGILWSSHHGGLDSVHPQLIATAAPEHVIISARPGFHKTIPEEETVAVYQRFTRTAIHKTYEKGSFTLDL